MEAGRWDAPSSDTSGLPRACPRRPTADAAMRHLVRAILDEAWSPHDAARRLLQSVGGDLSVLHRAHARVLRAATERTTGTTERAIATLDLALRIETT